MPPPPPARPVRTPEIRWYRLELLSLMLAVEVVHSPPEPRLCHPRRSKQFALDECLVLLIGDFLDHGGQKSVTVVGVEEIISRLDVKGLSENGQDGRVTICDAGGGEIVPNPGGVSEQLVNGEGTTIRMDIGKETSDRIVE